MPVSAIATNRVELLCGSCGEERGTSVRCPSFSEVAVAAFLPTREPLSFYQWCGRGTPTQGQR